jgi:hypothetical protein
MHVNAHKEMNIKTSPRIALIITDSYVTDPPPIPPKTIIGGNEVVHEQTEIQGGKITDFHRDILKDIKAGYYRTYNGTAPISSFIKRYNKLDIEYIYNPNCSPSFKEHAKKFNQKLGGHNVNIMMSKKRIFSIDEKIENSCTSDTNADLVVTVSTKILALRDGGNLLQKQNAAEAAVKNVLNFYKEYYFPTSVPFASLNSIYTVTKRDNTIIYLGKHYSKILEKDDIAEHYSSLLDEAFYRAKNSEYYVNEGNK